VPNLDVVFFVGGRPGLRRWRRWKAGLPHETISGTISGKPRHRGLRSPLLEGPEVRRGPEDLGPAGPLRQGLAHGRGRSHHARHRAAARFGETVVPAGHTPSTCSHEDGTAKLIINKQLGQWGTIYKKTWTSPAWTLKKDAVEKTVDQFTVCPRKGRHRRRAQGDVGERDVFRRVAVKK